MGHGSRATARRWPIRPETSGGRVWAYSSWLCPTSRADCGGVDRRAHLLEGAAPANIGNRLVDVGVSRLRLFLQQRRDRHDHAALAVAALRHVEIDPGLLDFGEHSVLGEALDGGDLLAGRVAGYDAARARRHAVDMHGAGAALRDTAAVLCPGH